MPGYAAWPQQDGLQMSSPGIRIAWADAILDGFERLAVTKANQRAALVADVGMCLGFVSLGLARPDTHPISAALTLMAGLLLFSLIEYSFHRWLFHGPEQAMERGHRRHHQDPTGIGSLPFFLPPIFLVVLAALFSKLMPLSDALLFTGGIAGGYCAYGLCHDWIHRARFRNRLGRRWAANHHIHHHHPDHNFGVTSPLWDIVFGTYYVSKSARRR
ncbi:MAG: sterol desaturase family protein [Lysobacterales bacterium]